MRSRGLEKVWKAVPLPQAFHTALESRDWLHALQLYQRHPYHAPPVDTFDLLKTVMHCTGVGVDDVKGRFNEKVRLTAILQRTTPEEVEWSVFWDALNKGDGKTISAALAGAHIGSAAQQIAVAEACAVLLKAIGENWEERLVDSTPFATVTRCNLINIALTERRPDVATEMLRHLRLVRSDVATLWPLMERFTWQEVLEMISACPKNSVPYHKVLPFILRQGCSLQTLSEHLEQARVLGDVDVVAPLLDYAVETENWPYVQRAVEHLVDIGQVTSAARNAFDHLCKLHGPKRVCQNLRDHRVELKRLTIKDLETLRF